MIEMPDIDPGGGESRRVGCDRERNVLDSSPVTTSAAAGRNGVGFLSKSSIALIVVTLVLFLAYSVDVSARNKGVEDPFEKQSPAITKFYGSNATLPLEQLKTSFKPDTDSPQDSVLVETDREQPVEKPVSDDSGFDTDHPRLGTRHLYETRGQPITDEEREAIIQQWGSWTLTDEKERPKEDYYDAYPNRDIPYEDFPTNAWQTDQEYLADFLPEALALVNRVQMAILAEYGKTNSSDMFNVEILDTWDGQNFVGSKGLASHRPSMKQGGFTNRRSWNGLVRRLLHAVMTEDIFVFAMGGHSAAAGHGCVKSDVG